MNLRLLSPVVAALGAVACSSGASSVNPPRDAGRDAPESAADVVTEGAAHKPETSTGGDGCAPSVTTASVSCTEANTSCPDIVVAGDVPTPGTGGFYGYADPTERADPGSPTGGWMMYSWLVETPVDVDGGKVVVGLSENHLAQSSDQGQSWTKDLVVWPTIPTMSHGVSGYLSSETAGFSVGTSGSAAAWYAIHERYFTPAKDGYNPQAQTITVRVATAATLADLATQTPSDELVLSGSGLDPTFGPSVNLSAVAGASAVPAVAACPVWHDTDIFFDHGELFVGVECVVDDPSNAVLAIFATTPSGAMTSWTWHLAGTVGDPQIAAELTAQLGLSPAATSMTQVNMTRSKDGQLLVVLSPTSVTDRDASFSANQVHMGNVAVQLDALDPVTFTRDCAGHLVVPARTTADDEVVGTGSSTYDPGLKSGILLDRQPTHTTGFEIHATGLAP